jgi:cellulose synthase/poly-beta-1,6-N-acetylglucosamine synthase-like glycosyltransferase
LGLSLYLNGKKMGYDPNALVSVKFPSNISDYYHQKSRTRSGWIQILNFAPDQMRALRKLQRDVIFSRIREGNFLSFICFLLDNVIWILDRIFVHDASSRYAWKQIQSTK